TRYIFPECINAISICVRDNALMRSNLQPQTFTWKQKKIITIISLLVLGTTQAQTKTKIPSGDTTATTY
ncbi:hypothetical protein, partial [Streptococcus pneumoniae]|uniref:hypothetical protein n=1 Tax=Streptococcus pneumoniae TaxID=1313 RepID=UPI001953712D